MEEAAASNRRSLSEEIEARLEAANMAQGMADFLFGSGMRLEELLVLRRYLEAIKEATTRAGGQASRWWVYAAAAPFSLDRDRMAQAWMDGNLDPGAFDVAAMATPIRAETEKRRRDRR